ncbi:Na+/H+ antiporter NhaA [Pseudokineococcus marinus]|uniref:Na(+)/H(+) antiporter NhaA n=1 Tax=Pseudokineococcus marinus TaxID=351215 RepID=A0A849BPW9_9ACTN|nr:Na+/H+ antiporter NhaA [Pseudokineococcus marinus]NNH23413.1 Na+/H+ antiporter NhaA [Pseudokineococcus marinus]
MIGRVRAVLEDERAGGLLLILGALVAVVWANSPWREAYTELSETVVGPASLHLDLSLATWAADGVLAVFFFVVGLEITHEVRGGSLRDPRRAAMPALAALGGMLMPAIFYTVAVLETGGEGLRGWAVPTATDIAFAVAVLVVFGRGLPGSVRTFLLTLAVVDDLLAITVIAIFYTDDLALPWFGAALVPLAVFAWLVRRRPSSTGAHRALIAGAMVLAVVTWTLVHASGVHATVAGVLLGAAVPALPRRGEDEAVGQRVNRVVNPLSSGVALPVFAFFAAGVTVVGTGGLGQVFSHPVAIGVILGLVGGKPIGVLLTVTVLERFTPLRLAEDQAPRDLFGVAVLAGIGFTVSLLVCELAFPPGELREAAKVAVLGASVVSATLGAVALQVQKRRIGMDPAEPAAIG